MKQKPSKLISKAFDEGNKFDEIVGIAYAVKQIKIILDDMDSRITQLEKGK